MQSTVISGRFVSLLILSLLVSMPLSASLAYADYLIGPAPVVFVEPMQCSSCHEVRSYHYKKHYVVKHRMHYRHYRRHSCPYAVPVCVYRYHPQPEPVAFIAGAPTGRGRYVNLNQCEPYDPDMTTGDDDPTIYPGMDIDN